MPCGRKLCQRSQISASRLEYHVERINSLVQETHIPHIFPETHTRWHQTPTFSSSFESLASCRILTIRKSFVRMSAVRVLPFQISFLLKESSLPETGTESPAVSSAAPDRLLLSIIHISSVHLSDRLCVHQSLHSVGLSSNPSARDQVSQEK